MAAGEVVEAVTEEVATNLEEVAQVTRSINPSSVSYFAAGLGVGIAIGFFFGYRFNREKLRLEAFKESQLEIDEIREDYRRRAAVLEKPRLEEVIEERGYDTSSAEMDRPLRAPVPITEITSRAHPTLPYHISSQNSDEAENANTDWDYPAELAQRTQEAPYIIHEDEMREQAGYNSVTYTYYVEDDVLVDEDDRPIPHPDLVVGENNLRFGHGSNSPDVVFVRNDRLELDMEISRSPGSYEREVLGLDTQDELEHSDRSVERRRHSGRRHRLEDESN